MGSLWLYMFCSVSFYCKLKMKLDHLVLIQKFQIKLNQSISIISNYIRERERDCLDIFILRPHE